MSSNLTAIELLEKGNEDRKKTVLTTYWGPILGLGFGICTGVFVNQATRRPPYSGIQKHILAIGGWTALFTFIQHKRDDYYSEKDAVLRHYIKLHPEDFPAPARKKIGDILEEWIPIR